jgi:CheY-like chemotaxis protein
MFNALIVEDNRLFSEALSAVLQAHFPFLTLTKAAGVQEALATVDSLRPDLVSTDIRLPDGNGLDIARSIRAAGIETVIIVLTSHDAPEYRDAALSSGADYFMSKSSIEISDIFGVVESILASRFRVLIAAEGAAFGKEMEVFLTRGWPGTVVACAGEREKVLETADALKPDLIVVHSESNAEWDGRLREVIGALRTRWNTAVVEVCGAEFARAWPVNHRIEHGAAFSQAMVTVIDEVRAVRANRMER